MHEHVPVRRVIDEVSHIYRLYRESGISASEDMERQQARLFFLRTLINNLKHERSRPSPKALIELSKRTQLAIGGSFRLLGYKLDELREADRLLNGHRTRIIESYPFHRDREIDLPHLLSETDALDRSAFASEVVVRWQRDLPIRVLQGSSWQRKGTFYVQLGTEDHQALSGLPPGAILLIEPVSNKERFQPDSRAIYCLQFGDGYRCAGCSFTKGKLVLSALDYSYRGRYEYFYPEEVRIVGRARGFATSLPTFTSKMRDIPQTRSAAPMLLPWEQPSLSSLLRTKRWRFGLNEEALRRANPILESVVGTGLSWRTLRRYQHDTQSIPHTDVLLALTLFHSARISDVLRLLGFEKDEPSHSSLRTWLEARRFEELPGNGFLATIPEPRDRWFKLFDEWGEWPALLSMTIPRMAQLQHRILRIRSHATFDGLDPILRPGTIVFIEERRHWPDTQADRRLSGWNRSIYAIRYRQEVLCGYLDSDDRHIALIPHPRSLARRVSFLRHQVEMVGKVIALASPVR
jgi:hypothetical protein